MNPCELFVLQERGLKEAKVNGENIYSKEMTIRFWLYILCGTSETASLFLMRE